MAHYGARHVVETPHQQGASNRQDLAGNTRRVDPRSRRQAEMASRTSLPSALAFAGFVPWQAWILVPWAPLSLGHS